MDMTPTPFEALVSAVERIGGQSAMARLCQVTQPTVWNWVHGLRQLPSRFVLRVEAATGVSRHWLDPHHYPVEQAGPSNTWNALDRREHVVTFVDRPVSISDRDTAIRYGTGR